MLDQLVPEDPSSLGCYGSVSPAPAAHRGTAYGLHFPVAMLPLCAGLRGGFQGRFDILVCVVSKKERAVCSPPARELCWKTRRVINVCGVNYPGLQLESGKLLGLIAVSSSDLQSLSAGFFDLTKHRAAVLRGSFPSLSGGILLSGCKRTVHEMCNFEV